MKVVLFFKMEFSIKGGINIVMREKFGFYDEECDI